MWRKQQGMTFWGLLVVATVAGIFIYVTLKLLPPYLEAMKVRTAVDNVARQGSINSRQEAEAALQRRFDVDDVRTVALQQALTLERDATGAVRVRVAWEVKVPLAYNLSALLEFDHSAVAR